MTPFLDPVREQELLKLAERKRLHFPEKSYSSLTVVGGGLAHVGFHLASDGIVPEDRIAMISSAA